MKTINNEPPTYKWSHAFEWLESAVQHGRIGKESLMELIAEHVDSDAIQDAFQEEMDSDGYFTPTNLEPDPDEEETED